MLSFFFCVDFRIIQSLVSDSDIFQIILGSVKDIRLFSNVLTSRGQSKTQSDIIKLLFGSNSIAND